MSKKLSDLDPRFLPLANALIAGCVEAGIAVVIITTLRTVTEEQQKVAEGKSAIMHSKHLTGMAMDLAPWLSWNWEGDASINWQAGSGPEHVLEPWSTMGKIGEALGLRWGGRWHHPFDPGHFELDLPLKSEEPPWTSDQRKTTIS